MSMAVPVMLLANPDERPRKKKATGGKTMAKKKGRRDAHGRFVATKKAKSNPKSGSAPKRKKPRSRTSNPGNPPPKKRRAAHRRRSNPGKKGRRHPRRRNSGTTGGMSKGKVGAQVAAGVLIGGVAAGGAEYAMAGSEMLATPGRRAAVHGVLAVLSGVASAMAPKAAPLLATIAGSFAGNAGTNGVKAIASGSAAPSATKAATPASAPGQMAGGVIAPKGMRGAVVRQLPAGQPMRGGVLSLSQMRGLVERTRLAPARTTGDRNDDKERRRRNDHGRQSDHPVHAGGP